jgi:phage repressor protein C with HTH and peptisase S24 domain
MSEGYINIGQRLKEFRERSNTKMPSIAAITGIKKETLYKWEKGTKPSDINDYFKLKAHLDLMENKLEDEIIEFENKKPSTLRLPLNHRKAATPQTDGKVAAGTVIFFENEPELIVDRINAPFLGLVEGAIEVTGSSMEPTFPNGCRVIITRLNNIRVLDNGKYYLIIDTNWQGIIRRVYQGNKENSFRLVSDNPDQLKYPPIERSLDQIEAIFLVGASIIKY